jgi:hypothetical protein
VKHPAQFRLSYRLATVPGEAAERIAQEIVASLRQAEALHPGWPDDPMQGACIVAEESGEMCNAATEMVFRNATPHQLRLEALQTAAVCMRMVRWCDEQIKAAP